MPNNPTAALFPDHDYVWTVDDYVDRVTKRKKRAVNRLLRELERARASGWPSARAPNVFALESDAWAFALNRATAKLADTEKQAILDRKRIAKCQKRLADALGSQGERSDA